MILLRRLRIDAFKHLRNIDLWFPRQGSVLIEGHNESGKSTLFEAIYFALYGKALVGEDSGAPSLEALVPHGESHARVQLTILAGVTELEISRTLTSRPQRVMHDAVVHIHRPGQPVETLSAVKAVNDCILAEMNGLDSNVLRNSCLMEQQALDRIESLSRSDRELAIAKLLGIETIQRIEHDLKVATKDGDALAQAQTRTFEPISAELKAYLLTVRDVRAHLPGPLGHARLRPLDGDRLADQADLGVDPDEAVAQIRHLVCVLHGGDATCRRPPGSRRPWSAACRTRRPGGSASPHG